MEYKKTIFQQYSAPIRTAATTKKWFQHFALYSTSRPGQDPILRTCREL